MSQENEPLMAETSCEDCGRQFYYYESVYRLEGHEMWLCEECHGLRFTSRGWLEYIAIYGFHTILDYLDKATRKKLVKTLNDEDLMPLSESISMTFEDEDRGGYCIEAI